MTEISEQEFSKLVYLTQAAVLAPSMIEKVRELGIQAGGTPVYKQALEAVLAEVAAAPHGPERIQILRNRAEELSNDSVFARRIAGRIMLGTLVEVIRKTRNP